jgi:hypothetical protein
MTIVFIYNCLLCYIFYYPFLLLVVLSPEQKVTNRKSLAYISKRPGKTQQFNYFAVNDKPQILRELKYGDNVGGQKDRDSFFIGTLIPFITSLL